MVARHGITLVEMRRGVALGVMVATIAARPGAGATWERGAGPLRVTVGPDFGYNATLGSVVAPRTHTPPPPLSSVPPTPPQAFQCARAQVELQARRVP